MILYLLATDGDSLVFVMDISRRRLLSYKTSGEPVADRPLEGGPSLHAAMGRMLYLSPDTLLDFWLSALGPFPLQDELFDTVHLVTALHHDGAVWPGGWGRPLHPEKDTDLMLRMGLQAGDDMAIWKDSLFVLRTVPGTVDVFGLNTSSYLPARTIQLKRWRRTTPARESGTGIIHTADGDRFADVGEVELDFVALAITLDEVGSLYVIQPTNEAVSTSFSAPNEVLAIYSRSGTLERSFRLPSLASRDVRVLPDGRIAILGIHEQDSLGGKAIMVFPGLNRIDRSRCE